MRILTRCSHHSCCCAELSKPCSNFLAAFWSYLALSSISCIFLQWRRISNHAPLMAILQPALKTFSVSLIASLSLASYWGFHRPTTFPCCKNPSLKNMSIFSSASALWHIHHFLTCSYFIVIPNFCFHCNLALFLTSPFNTYCFCTHQIS